MRMLHLATYASYLIFLELVTAIEQDDEEPGQFNLGVVIGITLGCVIPIMIVNTYQGFDNSPPSNIDELTARTFFGTVGGNKPAVVLFHEYDDPDCQEFRWTFEQIFEQYKKQGDNIAFATVDQTVEQSLGRHFGTHLKGSPTLLWFASKSKNPVFYSSMLLEAKPHWIVTWIERRLEKGSVGDANLIRIEQLIAELYHWFDGYDCSETEQIKLDNEVEGKSWIGRFMTGHEASVYGEVLPDGIQTLLDVIDTEFPFKREDVFVDLGSGTGKVVIHAALATPCKKVVGIELSETRHKHGLQALKEAQSIANSEQRSTPEEDVISLQDRELCQEFAQKIIDATTSGRLQLEQGDIMKPTYNDATHLYAASTTWPDTLLDTVAEIAINNVKKVKTFSTLRPLPRETLSRFRSIFLWKTVDLAVSWQDTAEMHIYRFREVSSKGKTTKVS